MLKRMAKSLALKIGGVIIFAELIVLGVLGFVYIDRYANQVYQRIEDRVLLPGKLIDARQLDYQSVADQEIMAQLVGREIVDSFLVNSDMTVFSSLNPAYQQMDVSEIPGVDLSIFDAERYTSQTRRMTEDGNTYIAGASLCFEADGETLSFFVYVKTGARDAESEIAGFRGLALFGSAATVALTALVVFLSFHFTILARIERLSQVLKRVESGDLQARVTGRIATDEIGLLQRGVNSVIGRIETLTAAGGENEARYRLLADNVMDVVGHIDAAGTYLYVSPACRAVLGYAPEEMVGEPLRNFVHPGDMASLPNFAAVVQPIEAFAINHRMMCKDGGHIWVETTVRLLPRADAEAQQEFILVSRDITEQWRVEQERALLVTQAQEHAQQVQQIINMMPEGVLLLNAQRRVVLVNPAGQRYLAQLAGGDVDDVLTCLGGRQVTELLSSPPADLWHDLDVGTDGDSPGFFRVIARPIETGPVQGGWVMVVRDVTRERELQEHVQQRDRLASVGQLAAGIAHDFNNILAVIVLYTQLVLRTAALPPKAQERLQTIVRQSRRATELIEQILDFSRRSVIERYPLDLVPLLKEQFKLLERTLPENITLDLVYSTDDYVVEADLTRIQQATMNLMLNARDAMPDGGQLSAELSRVRFGAGETPLPDMEPGAWVRLAITDSGSGIPPDVLPYIFEPFFTTKAPGKGAGLGLAQVYGIIKQHEGHIEVRTEFGKGTTFTFYLPAVSAPPVETPARGTQVVIHGDGETILIAEDDPVTRDALIDSLELLGYRVLTADNGLSALEIWERHRDKIELVLSDVVMPQMGGIALFQALKARGATVKVVLLTGHLLDEKLDHQISDLKSQGVAEWMQKPLSLGQLSQVVAQALGRLG
jgi:PAS domain S-box-containing protein